MSDELPGNTSTPSSRLPGIQILFLLLVLIIYPAISVVMDMLGKTDASEVTSKITQVYLPTLIIQAALLLALWVVLILSRESFSAIGLAREDVNLSNLISAIIFFIGAWGLMVLVRASMTGSGYLPPERDLMTILPANVIEGGLWAMLSIGAALSEELVFRGFAITRLKRITGRFWIGAILSSLAFSAGHLYQGVAGVFLTFLYGMLFAGLFAARRSVFPCIVAHFLQDIIALAAVFVKPQ